MKFSESHEDLWQFYNKGEFIVITTNAFVKKSGEAVMGAGIARQARDRFPGLQYAIGQAITKYGNVPVVNIKYRLITLPTKVIWTESADLELIKSGLQILVKIANELEFERLYLPRPGCGNGKRDWYSEVLPICDEILDSRFIICSR